MKKKVKIKILENTKDPRQLLKEEVNYMRKALSAFMLKNGILEFSLRRKLDASGAHQDTELTVKYK